MSDVSDSELDEMRVMWTTEVHQNGIKGELYREQCAECSAELKHLMPNPSQTELLNKAREWRESASGKWYEPRKALEKCANDLEDVCK